MLVDALRQVNNRSIRYSHHHEAIQGLVAEVKGGSTQFKVQSSEYIQHTEIARVLGI